MTDWNIRSTGRNAVPPEGARGWLGLSGPETKAWVWVCCQELRDRVGLLADQESDFL